MQPRKNVRRAGNALGSAAKLFGQRPRDNRFNPRELRPKSRNYIIREQDGERAWDVMTWDVLGGKAPWPMTNVRNLALPQWRKLAEKPENRCLVPLTEFCEFTHEKHDLGDGKPALKGKCGSPCQVSRCSPWPASGKQPRKEMASRW
ncbi:hypothetical protein GCM10020258_58590 [Sphingomonas yabuuchiae]